MRHTSSSLGLPGADTCKATGKVSLQKYFSPVRSRQMKNKKLGKGFTRSTRNLMMVPNKMQ